MPGAGGVAVGSGGLAVPKGGGQRGSGSRKKEAGGGGGGGVGGEEVGALFAVMMHQQGDSVEIKASSSHTHPNLRCRMLAYVGHMLMYADVC